MDNRDSRMEVEAIQQCCAMAGEALLSLPLSFVPRQGKNPEDVVRRYTEKIKVLPDEVGRAPHSHLHSLRVGFNPPTPQPIHPLTPNQTHTYTPPPYPPWSQRLMSTLSVKVMVSAQSADEAFRCAIPGLHHLHGEAGHVVGIRRHPAAQRHQARAGGQAWQVRPHVPSAVPGGHVQQWQ